MESGVDAVASVDIGLLYVKTEQYRKRAEASALLRESPPGGAG